MENFQALPKVLEDCIIRIPETVQDKFFFSVLMESGLMLSGRAAREYSGAHLVPEEAREAAEVIKRTAKPKLQI